MTSEANTDLPANHSHTRMVLLIILLFGLVLRIPGLFWGYGLLGHHQDFVALHPDEPRFVEIARGLHEHQPYRKSYVLGLGNFLRLGLVAGEWAGYPVTDAQLILMARGLSLFCGVGLILLAYVFMRELKFPTGAALLASALLAVNTLCVTQSHLGTADMPYTLLIYLFMLVAWRAWSRPSLLLCLTGSAIAGVALAVKFGAILIPAALVLPFRLDRSRGRSLILSLLCLGLLFCAAQGFSFDSESVRSILAGLRQDNVSGFHHNKWLNPMVYSLQILRCLGFFACAMLVCGFVYGRTKTHRLTWKTAVVFSPLVLHGLAIHGLHVPFPRHLLPLVPLLLMLTAATCWTLFKKPIPLALLLTGWSTILAVSDARSFHNDSRGGAMVWLAGQVPQDTTVWVDPYFKIPVHRFFPAAGPEQADFLLQHEGWYYRFERSELNPLRPPRSNELYHATFQDLQLHEAIVAGTNNGEWREVFRGGPRDVLPEQIVFRRLLGSFEKYSGMCRILERQARPDRPNQPATP